MTDGKLAIERLTEAVEGQCVELVAADLLFEALGYVATTPTFKSVPVEISLLAGGGTA